MPWYHNGDACWYIADNGATVNYFYDNLDRIVSLRYNNNEQTAFNYTYNRFGSVSAITDTASGIAKIYDYDTVGRLISARTENGTNDVFRTHYTYDGLSRLDTLKYVYSTSAGTRYTHEYSATYGEDSRVNTFGLNGIFSITPTFDGLGRQSSRVLKNGSGAQVDKEVYSFLVGAGGANASTSMVSSVGYYGSDSTVDETYTCTYDNLGNIKNVSKNGTQIAAYTYNSFNMLTGYTDADGNTYTYGYSSGKNISETGKYLLFYTDDVWLDRVTCITDDASGKVFGITYDGIGNTLSYRDGMSFTWKNGRQLATFTQGQTSVSYDYNENGIRNKKTVNGITTSYILAGSTIVSENRNGNFIQYYYNEAGSVIGLRYNGNDYFFRRNLQGDIISILNTAGQTVVSYEYDPWGNILSTSGSMAATLGADNPFRYRGYYYDTESGLYYLQTRYYDPAVGRFINADGYTSTGQGFLGNNMYAYCLYNPISYTDPSGNVAKEQQIIRSDTEGMVITYQCYHINYKRPRILPIYGTYGNGKGNVYIVNLSAGNLKKYYLAPNDVVVRDLRNNLDSNGRHDPNMQVVDSYRIENQLEQAEIILYIILYNKRFPSSPKWSRSPTSMLDEWAAHNTAYKYSQKIGFLSEYGDRARSVDFNNADEFLS